MDIDAWRFVCRRSNDDSGQWSCALDACQHRPVAVLILGRKATLSVGVFKNVRAPDYNRLQPAITVKGILTDEQSFQALHRSHDLDIKGRQKVFSQIQRDEFFLESEQTNWKRRNLVAFQVQELQESQFREEAYFKGCQLVMVEVKDFEAQKWIEYMSGK